MPRVADYFNTLVYIFIMVFSKISFKNMSKFFKQSQSLTFLSRVFWLAFTSFPKFDALTMPTAFSQAGFTANIAVTGDAYAIIVLSTFRARWEFLARLTKESFLTFAFETVRALTVTATPS